MEAFIHKRYYLVDIYILQHLKNEGDYGSKQCSDLFAQRMQSPATDARGQCRPAPPQVSGIPVPHHLPPHVSSGKGTAHLVTVPQPQLYICTGLDYRSINYISKLHLTYN